MLMQNLKKGIGYKISLNSTKGEISHYYEFILCRLSVFSSMFQCPLARKSMTITCKYQAILLKNFLNDFIQFDYSFFRYNFTSPVDSYAFYTC